MSQLESSVSWAERCYKINAKRSPLYALPYEVLAHIRGYLDHTEKICFVLSGAKLIETFPFITVQEDKVGDIRIGVYVRLLRDDFYKEAHKQSGTWCVYCADVHEDPRFVGKMLCYLPRDRRCSPTLKLCSHWSYSLKSLKANVARAASFRGRQAMHLGLRYYTCETGLEESRIYSNGRRVTYDRISGDYILRSLIVINFAKVEASDLYTKARADLQALDFTACLHMRTSEESTINRLVDAETGAFKVEKLHEVYRVHCEHCKTMTRTKSVSIRGTTGFYRPDKSSGLRIDILRNLGKLTNEDNPTWRAHFRERQLKVTKDQGDLIRLELGWILQ
ncbi:hypothetical protein J4E91_002964 [Alternaria rosae]|nr:hypothetical protein J4E91_002964 [Alternaria rosae]